MPVILSNAVLYKLCLVDREKLGRTINDYLKIIIRDKREVQLLVSEFWQKSVSRLDPQMLKRVGPEDIIISAGPDFLLDGIRGRLGTGRIICSEVDLDKKEIIYFNFKDNKVRRFRKLYGDARIERFYTDSYNDQAVMDISDKVFLVKKGKIKRIK